MKFAEKLDEYIEAVGCTAKDLSERSQLSPATISRYRSGERVARPGTDAFQNLCDAIAELAPENSGYDAHSIEESFLRCSDVSKVNNDLLCCNFEALASALDINMSELGAYMNYDVSTLVRYRNGSRRPSDSEAFMTSFADYVAKKTCDAAKREKLAKLLDCDVDRIEDRELRARIVCNWMGESTVRVQDMRGRGRDSYVSGFFSNIAEFDFGEYIKSVRFDEMKVPTAPFHLPANKHYHGIESMKAAELDFLKTVVLSKSMEPVVMYSDMPMEEQARDQDFAKKWMFGMGLMLKKGLQLKQIHNLDRSFGDMMLGVEGWIPMYMTGQVSPYYLKDVQNNVFSHLLKVSGDTALSGEAIAGHHDEGRYILTNSKKEMPYYKRRAQDLLAAAEPLMDIYLEDRRGEFEAFLLAESEKGGTWRNMLSSLSLFTMDPCYLEGFLRKRDLDEAQIGQILEHAQLQRRVAEGILQTGRIEESVPDLLAEDFCARPRLLVLSGLFCERDVVYGYEEYREHLRQMESYAAMHPGYSFVLEKRQVFDNLQIHVRSGSWAMVSKSKNPAIHFVIRHPKLVEAIEKFEPPLSD